jgi:hypothetical protein
MKEMHAQPDMTRARPKVADPGNSAAMVDIAGRLGGPTPAFRKNNPNLALQRILGNQGMQRAPQTRAIQTKLRISQPNDPYEREADRVADQVMRMPNPAHADEAPCPVCAGSSTPCPTCAARKPAEVQRRATPGGADHAASTVPDGLAGLLGPGQPLASAARAFFEPRFGRDFGHVQIHTDAAAADTAQSMDAHAFTVGQDIAFAAGQFQPGTLDGRQLLAHELTHVLQQRGAPGLDASAAASTALSQGPRALARKEGGGIGIREMTGDAMIQRACVAGLIPSLSCCIPGVPATRVGTIAHSQLQIGAGLISPGTIGEVAIPPVPHGVPPPSRGWRFADLYDTAPRTPISAPNRAGLPPFLAAVHPEINPVGWPVVRVPPGPVATSAGLGEIKPLSVGGLSTGPAHLALNIAQYDLWSVSLSGAPIAMSPVIPGGPLGHPANWLFAFRTMPGVYNYCCFDVRRVARAVARALRRLWEFVRDLWRRLRRWLGENWELVLALVLLIIAIILIIIFWEAIVAGIVAVIAAILAFLAWLAGVLAPAAGFATAVLLLMLLLSPNEASAQTPAGSEGAPQEGTEEAPAREGMSDPTDSPPLPVAIPDIVESAGAATAAGLEATLGGALNMISRYLDKPASIPAFPSGMMLGILAGVPGALGSVLPHIQGSPIHSEARGMIMEFLSRLPGAGPGANPPAVG